MDTFVQGYHQPNVNGDLFAGMALCEAAHPQACRVINEDSDELVRIHNKGRDFSLGYMDGATADLNSGALRIVLIKVIALAYQDLALAMKRPDPRQVVRKGPHGTVVSSENYDFRSAVSFFFRQSTVYDEDNEFVGCYSAFNSYCALLELDAPRVRRTLLNLYPCLEEIIRAYIPNTDFVAPVASTGLWGGKTLRDAGIGLCL